MKTVDLQFQMSDQEVNALKRFVETCEDGEGYDVQKPMMQRLATYGLVRRVTGSLYEITKIGEVAIAQLTPLVATPDGGEPLYAVPVGAYQWPKPDVGDGTWAVDPRYLRSLQEAMTEEFKPSMEDVEAVLLALVATRSLR